MDFTPAVYASLLNLKRRHLTSSQKAAISVESLPFYEAEAKERMRLSTGRPTEESKKVVKEFTTFSEDDKEAAKFKPDPNDLKASAQAANAFKTNSTYVSLAKTLKEEAPDLFEEVKAGK